MFPSRCFQSVIGWDFVCTHPRGMFMLGSWRFAMLLMFYRVDFRLELNINIFRGHFRALFHLLSGMLESAMMNGGLSVLRQFLRVFPPIEVIT